MNRAVKYFPAVLLLFHLIGIGLFIYFGTAPEHSYLNILMSAVLVFLAEKNVPGASIPFTVIFISGFLIELIGVRTGYLFGNYSYSASMGPLVMGTPVIIGATWYAVVAGAANLSRYVRGSILQKSFLTGFLAVIMDLLIEQVAMRYDLWEWKEGVIPVYNYLCWFVFGSLFAALYLKITTDRNKTAVYLFLIWIGFFSILSLF